jgi:hypothetical protein
MIVESKIIFPVKYNSIELGLKYIPSIENNHYVRIINSIIELDFIYKPMAIVFELPYKFYIRLKYWDEKRFNKDFPRKISLEDITLAGRFDEEHEMIPFMCNQLFELELPEIPKWANYIITKESSPHKGFYSVKNVQIESDERICHLKLEKVGDFQSTLDFLTRLGYPTGI